jgi:hypothetical protein
VAKIESLKAMENKNTIILEEIVESCPACLKETNSEYPLMPESGWSPLAPGYSICTKCGQKYQFKIVNEYDPNGRTHIIGGGKNMKKIIVLLTLTICSCSTVFAETYYRMSRKDYIDLCSKISALDTDKEFDTYSDTMAKELTLQELTIIKNKLEKYDTESSFSKDIADKVDKTQLTDGQWKDVEHLITQLKGKSYDDDMFIIRGKIDLLEMEILKLKGKK